MIQPLKIKSKQNTEPNDELRQKAKRWDDVKTQYRQNEDGTRSSHRMAYSTTDNGAIAYPTIYPRDRKGTESHDTKDWIELKGREAIDTAKARGEIYKFKNEQNAAKWSEGEYKKN